MPTPPNGRCRSRVQGCRHPLFERLAQDTTQSAHKRESWLSIADLVDETNHRRFHIIQLVRLSTSIFFQATEGILLRHQLTTVNAGPENLEPGLTDLSCTGDGLEELELLIRHVATLPKGQ